MKKTLKLQELLDWVCKHPQLKKDLKAYFNLSDDDIESCLNEKPEKHYKAYIETQDEYFDDLSPLYENEIVRIYVNSRDEKRYGIESTIDKETLEKCKQDKNFTILPLSIYEHSGVALVVGSAIDPWDSWQSGYVVVDNREINENALKVAQEIIENYNQFYNGYLLQVSIYECKKCKECGQEIKEQIDSCCGFYDKDEALGYIRSIIGDNKKVEIIENY